MYWSEAKTTITQSLFSLTNQKSSATSSILLHVFLMKCYQVTFEKNYKSNVSFKEISGAFTTILAKKELFI